MSAVTIKDQTLTHWRKSFAQFLKSEKRASPYTQRNYNATLERFELFLTGYRGGAISTAALADLETRDFRAFLAQRRTEGLSPPSIKLELSALKTFFSFLKSVRTSIMTPLR